MNKVALLFLLIAAPFISNAQIDMPAASPAATLIQKVGLTDITVSYSRPSAKGRVIFGDLVPYDKLWRTGANGYTTVSFNTDVTIGDAQVVAGTYALITKPSKTTWEVYFYAETVGGGVPQEWIEDKVVAKLTVPVVATTLPLETFTITVDAIKTNNAVLGLRWERVYVAIPFSLGTDVTVAENIEKALNGPSAMDYYSAAVYYATEGKDINKANDWMNKAIAMTPIPAFWQWRQQSLIQAKMGDKKAAIATAKKSLEAAKAAGNDDYIKMNFDSLKEWGAL